jgi:hypothetical protein
MEFCGLKFSVIWVWGMSDPGIVLSKVRAEALDGYINLLLLLFLLSSSTTLLLLSKRKGSS